MINREDGIRKVRVIGNPKSGLWWAVGGMRRILHDTWDVDGIDLTYQFSRSPEDGKGKVRRAVEDGVDTIIVVGGDGMINTLGAELVGTDTALAVIPAGSGNGFARHFGIPLWPEHAAKVLKNGKRERIDVGLANGRPFFVTCGLAWDADLVRGFEKSPIRGIFPYVFAGIYHYLTYEPQKVDLLLDGEAHSIVKPIVLTAANLTQYGGGAKIAPMAKPDDGKLELVCVPEIDELKILTRFHKLFDGNLTDIPEITTKQFQRLELSREKSAPIQLDGELIENIRELTIEVKPDALEVIVPAEPVKKRALWSQEDTPKNIESE